MKRQANLYLPIATVEELRERALHVGANIGDLADLFLRKGLATASDDALRKWAAEQHSRRGRPLVGGLRKNEHLVLAAFDALGKRDAPAWRFDLESIAAEAGLLITPAFLALKALQKRGDVVGMELEKLDRWGRPRESFWSLVSALPEVERARLAGAA